MRKVLIRMVASIAVLGVMSALNINSQMFVERSDCYERSAIGQRLTSKSVYRTFNYTNVTDCKKACTKDREACKSFSFGTSAKGNGTCELSTDIIKETADLKPIGTVADKEFDLYTKKLGCFIVVDKSPQQHQSNDTNYTQTTKPDTLGNINELDTSGSTYQRPHQPPYTPNSEHSPDRAGDEVHRVGSELIAVASGADTYLHPVGEHDVIVSKNRRCGGCDKPEGQTASHHSPHDYRYHYQHSSHSQNYGSWYAESTSGYNYEPSAVNNGRPYEDTRKQDTSTHIQNHRLNDRYGTWSDGEISSDYYPIVPAYGSLIPHPDEYYGRPPEHNHLSKPGGDRLHTTNNRPGDYYYYYDKPLYDKPEYNKPVGYPSYHYDKPFYNSYEYAKDQYDKPTDYASYRYDKPMDYPSYNYDVPRHPLLNDEKAFDLKTKTSTDTPLASEDQGEPAQPHSPSPQDKPADIVPEPSANGQKHNCKGCPLTGGEKGKSIVTHSVGSRGQQVTSIITDITDRVIGMGGKDACFRRALAGKRVSRAFVKDAITCETVEECQRECSEERRFVCEGFNYRLDPSGGKGDCELLDCPLTQLDLRRDIDHDPDYDYYERDRNAEECGRGRRLQGSYRGRGGYGAGFSGNYGGSYGSSWQYNSYGSGGYDGNRYGSNRWNGNADRRYDQGGAYPRRGYGGGDRWPSYDRPRRPYLPPADRPDYGSGSSGRRDPYHSHQLPYEHDRRYPGTPEYTHETYLPSKQPHQATDRIVFVSEDKDRYLPPKIDSTSDWGLYSDSKSLQSYGSSYNRDGNYDYWYSDQRKPVGGYLPEKPLFSRPYQGNHLVPFDNFDNHILPPENNRVPHRYDPKRDECSLRMASGFKLHRTVVRGIFSVQNINECELLCFKEIAFLCASYAYRYTLPADNCQLSSKNYKDLNYYTDLEPDRDFDIYTMNNRDKCAASITNTREGKERSECFLRVRSGQRLDQSIVKDSLTTKSVVECQIECLRAVRFTCRAFSFRYGPAVIGGVIDNCQLTDCPFYELDPRKHFLPEAGFEIYERASFGRGCEPDHFVIGGNGHQNKVKKVDQLCYIGFGTSAKLLPQGIRKALYAPSEIDCKTECSKARHGSLFQCMSFSFRPSGPKFEPNCHLSDILQRDLLIEIDYVYDPNWKLFAWDNFSPECVAIIYEAVDDNHLEHDHKHVPYDYGLDTWRVYSVSGWPCKKGTLCTENREAGFWYCELEGGANNAWDYCCRPDHQCGASYKYPYQWCYVGPSRTQWRKCSDSYFPYIRHLIDERVDHHPKPYLPPSEDLYPPTLYRPGARPDRPPAGPLPPPLPTPSLNEYEMTFDEEFLSLKPPKLPTGALAQSRHWPVSYLHNEMPPNITHRDSLPMKMESRDSTKYQAIENLINVIKSNDLANLEYHISNSSNKNDDILFVRIPLPTNFTREASKSERNVITSSTSAELSSSERKRSPKVFSDDDEEASTPPWVRNLRRGFITKTNVTTHGMRA